jgi:hypothetical protein
MFYCKASTTIRYLTYSLLAIYALSCSPNVSQPLTSQPLKEKPQEQKQSPPTPTSPSIRPTEAIEENKKIAQGDRLPTPSPSIQPTQPRGVNSVLPVAKNPKPNPIFRPIFPALKYYTKIPVLLPTYIPESDKPNQVFAILENSTLTQYQIMLASTENCRGDNTCRLGSISGKEDISKSISKDAKAIDLNATTTAYFKPSKCTDVCSDATLTWYQGKYLYTFTIKDGSQDTLIKIANSAIANGSL